MIRVIDAVYENGVLRPLKPLSLAESQRVKLTILEASGGESQKDLRLLARARSEVALLEHTPTIEEVRSMLACIPGSMSEDVIDEREDG